MTLKELRISKGLNQAQCAEYLGMSTRNYQNYEYGKSQPGYVILSHIIRNLPADPRELFESGIYDVNDTTREHINRLLDKCNGDQLRLTLKLVQGVLDEWPK